MIEAALAEITEAREDDSFADIIINCDCFVRAYNCLRIHFYPETWMGPRSAPWPGTIPLSAVLAIDRPQAVKNLGLKTYAAICKAFKESGIDYRDAPWWLTVPVSWRDRVMAEKEE